MAGNPSLQFYPGDWLRDDVSACSLAAQGLWLRMMFIAHDSGNYGFLEINGEPMPHAMIARKCGCGIEEFESLLAELESVGVPGRSSNGCIYSRRMVRDGAKMKSVSKKRSEAGKSGAKKRWDSGEEWQNDGKQDGKPMANAMANAWQTNGSSSSISSSLSISEEKKIQRPQAAFVKPTVDEIGLYCAERNNSVDAQSFFDHYESNGWMVGRVKMKDWKATVRKWEKSRIDEKPTSKPVSRMSPHEQLMAEMAERKQNGLF